MYNNPTQLSATQRQRAANAAQRLTEFHSYNIKRERQFSFGPVVRVRPDGTVHQKKRTLPNY